MPEIVKATYHNLSVSFTEEAWFNATAIAEKYGKRVADWLETKDTQDYIVALAAILNVPKTALLKAKRGRYGGTWMHPKLGVDLSVSFTDEALDDVHNHAKQRDLNTGESGSSNTGKSRLYVKALESTYGKIPYVKTDAPTDAER